VVATESINLAIAQCDAKVGVDNYCAVQVDTKNAAPFLINRSKTRVYAVSADTAKSTGTMQSVPDQATITIGSNTEKVVIENLQLVGARATRQWKYSY